MVVISRLKKQQAYNFNLKRMLPEYYILALANSFTINSFALNAENISVFYF
jgi:hypothetical protein